MKFGHLTAGGVLGDDTVELLGGVPENVTMFASAWVPRATFRSRACILLACLSVSFGLDAPAPSPQEGLGREVSWWRWWHDCHGGLHGRPLPTGPDPNRA
jgi:hypothetical protein